MPDLSEFSNVSLGTFDEDVCSPAVDEKFRGLVISAPKKIPLSEDIVFPVCGTYQVDEGELIKYRSFENEIVIIVTDMTDNKPYSGNLLENGFEPDILDGFRSDDEVSNVVVTGWFNVDLYRQISKLPRLPGKYQVFATIGDMKSNVVAVDLIKK